MSQAPLDVDVTSDANAEAPMNEPTTKEKGAEGKSPTQIALSRLIKDKVALVCAIIVIFLVLVGIFAPLINSWFDIYAMPGPGAPRPTEVLNPATAMPVIGPPYHAFTWDHPLGVAPATGYDNLARLTLGLRTSLLVSVLATVIATIIGIVIGLLAGYARGWLDNVLSFVIDVFLSLPFILMALAAAPIVTDRFSSNEKELHIAEVFSVIFVLVFFGWMGLARLIRGQVLSLREREFVQAAEVIGVPTHRILFKELLPNLVAPIVVWVSLTLPAFVAAEAGLSFLGIGITGTPSLGQTINAATNYYESYPLFLWAPVLTVMVLVVALNLLGDSIRDAFDPKTRR